MHDAYHVHATRGPDVTATMAPTMCNNGTATGCLPGSVGLPGTRRCLTWPRHTPSEVYTRAIAQASCAGLSGSERLSA